MVLCDPCEWGHLTLQRVAAHRLRTGELVDRLHRLPGLSYALWSVPHKPGLLVPVCDLSI